jgi:hypothetical protein
MFSCLTWLKVVEPSVRMGERTWALEMTWMRKTSARRGRQSLRKARKMRFSPFWLKMRMPESMAACFEKRWQGMGGVCFPVLTLDAELH